MYSLRPSGPQLHFSTNPFGDCCLCGSNFHTVHVATCGTSSKTTSQPTMTDQLSSKLRCNGKIAVSTATCACSTHLYIYIYLYIYTENYVIYIYIYTFVFFSFSSAFLRLWPQCFLVPEAWGASAYILGGPEHLWALHPHCLLPPLTIK